MGRRTDYLERVPKTGAYRFCRGIPAHLRPYFPERGVAWRENLGTKIEAEARPRCLEVAARVERLFQEAQARYDADIPRTFKRRPPCLGRASSRTTEDYYKKTNMVDAGRLARGSRGTAMLEARP